MTDDYKARTMRHGESLEGVTVMATVKLSNKYDVTENPLAMLKSDLRISNLYY